MNYYSPLTLKYNSVLQPLAIFSFFLSKTQLAILKLRFVQSQWLPCLVDQKSTAYKLPGAILKAA